MKAGIVVYNRSPGKLIGKWSDESFTKGDLADEIVHDVPPGEISGRVEIFNLDHQLLFSGNLVSTKIGECLKLTWTGTFAGSQQKGTYEGIGREMDINLVVATFEPI